MYFYGYVGISNLCGLVGVNPHKEAAGTEGTMSFSGLFYSELALIWFCRTLFGAGQ